MIKLDIDLNDFEDINKLKKLISKCLWLQLGLGNNSVRHIVEKQRFNYYGKPSNHITLNQPIDFNYHKPLVDLSTKTFIGDLPDIVTKKQKDNEKKHISLFSQKLYENNLHQNIFKVGKDAGINGNGFMLLYHDKGDSFTKFRFLDPIYTNVVCDCSVEEKPLFAFNCIPINELGNGTNIKLKYRVYIYTKEHIYAFETKPITTISKPNSIGVVPYNCFLISGFDNTIGANTETLDFKVPHDYKDIPIIEFPNNYERVGDTLCVDDLIKLYTKLQNNRNANVEDVLRYILVLKNVRIGTEEEQQDVKTMIKDNRILPIEGEDADAQLLSNPLNQTDLETLAKSIKNDIHYICHIPDLSSVDFSQNASDPIIKIKTKPLLDLCLEKEIWFTKPYIKMLYLALEFARENDTDFNKYDFDLNSVVLKYSHTLPSNDLDATNMAVNLCNAGIGAPRELLQNIKAIGNVDDYMEDMYKWLDFVDNRKKSLENNNKGVNETNIERQNATPVTKDQYDNMVNATKGDAKKINFEKV